MKNYILLASFVLSSFLTFAKPPKTTKINWISIEKAQLLNKKSSKPILVDIYTDWCKWCHEMDKNTYSDPVIINYINQNFYAVKLNAEQREAINFKEKKYNFVASGRSGYHELAAAMLQGKLSFPSTVFLDSKLNLIQVVPGYIETKTMEPLLQFMHQKKYENTEWSTFVKSFKSKVK